MTADEIKQWRGEHGLSRAELSRRLPAPYRTVQDWESGRRNPPDYLPRALRDLERELQPHE